MQRGFTLSIDRIYIDGLDLADWNVDEIRIASHYELVASNAPIDCLNAPPGDRNQDCTVDMLDLSLLTSEWLNCTDPANLVDCSP